MSNQVALEISFVSEDVLQNSNGNEYQKFAGNLLTADGKKTAFVATGTHYLKSTTPLVLGQVYVCDGVTTNAGGDGYNVVGFLRTPVVSVNNLMSVLGYTTETPVPQEAPVDATAGDDLPF